MIRGEYEPTYDDYWRLSVTLTRQRGTTLLMVMMIAPFAAVAGVLLAAWGEAGPDIAAVPLASYFPVGLIAVFLYVVAPWQVLRSIRRQWDTLPQLREPRVYEFTDDGVRVRAESFAAQHSWSLVKSAAVVRGLLAIEDKQGAFHYLPKSAFNDNQWDALRDLIARHVPDARLPE